MDGGKPAQPPPSRSLREAKAMESERELTSASFRLIVSGEIGAKEILADHDEEAAD